MKKPISNFPSFPKASERRQFFPPNPIPASRRLWPITPNTGFTVIELMVVVLIMGLLLGVILANINGQRAARNLQIAQNQLETDVRKVQSYTLSSREVGSQAVEFYVLKFDLTNPSRYSVLAMYNVDSAPVLIAEETDQLPQGIQLSHVTINGSAITKTCALLAFATPFATSVTNDGCATSVNNCLTTTNNPSLPYTVISCDDYSKVIADTTTSLANSNTMVISLTASGSSLPAKTVTFNGVTGLVSAP